MYETYSTVIGTVITHPQRRTTNGGDEVISFRVASTVRYRGAGADTWQDGNTVYLTVNCWRRLVAGVGAAIGKGAPVIVHGQLSSSQYQTKDGVERSDLEMRAIAIGPDLARCICRIERNTKVGPTADEEVEKALLDGAPSGEEAPPGGETAHDGRDVAGGGPAGRDGADHEGDGADREGELEPAAM